MQGIILQQKHINTKTVNHGSPLLQALYP